MGLYLQGCYLFSFNVCCRRSCCTAYNFMSYITHILLLQMHGYHTRRLALASHSQMGGIMKAQQKMNKFKIPKEKKNMRREAELQF